MEDWEDDPATFSDDGDFISGEISDDDHILPITNDDTSSSTLREKNYVVLNETEIKRLQDQNISYVSSVLSISESGSSRLLYHYRWNLSLLQDEWFADEELVRRKVGLLCPANDQQNNLDFQSTCGICFDTFEGRDEIFSLGCDHLYCLTCWGGYVSTAINDSGPGCLSLRCPHPKCGAAVGREVIERVATKEEVEKYSSYFVRSYVEGKREMVKWCPAPGCDNAVEFERGGSNVYDVVCDCSYAFCWNCCEEAHRPVDCITVGMWIAKNSSEAENTSWILAYSKPCPKCKRPIEKNMGCNHMTCSAPCNYHFCWLCLGDYYNHGVCNRYEVGKGGKWKDEEERQRQMAQKLLQRYAHYYERWASNHKSRQKALEDLQKMETIHLKFLSEKLQEPETQLNFIVEAWQQIVECRRVLKWTYAYGYYLPERGKAKVQLFECLQGEAEAALERLHHCTETELSRDFLDDDDDDEPKQDLYAFRQKLIGLTKVTRSFFENLVKALENGLSEVKSSQAPHRAKGNKRKGSTLQTSQSKVVVNSDDDFGTWSCDVCTFINPEWANTCVMCRDRQ